MKSAEDSQAAVPLVTTTGPPPLTRKVSSKRRPTTTCEATPASRTSSSPYLKNCNKSACTASPLYARIVSGSVGSVLTSLLVTPLEVVKVRQQAMAFEQQQQRQWQWQRQRQSQFPTGRRGGSVGGVGVVPSHVSLCPRGCGTFVLNNGQIDCLLPRSAVGFFDQTTGRLTDAARSTLLMGSSINSGGGAVTHRRGATSSSAVTLARFGEASSSTPSSSAGTFELLRRIFRAEGLAGIYAGLRPTLVMAVPNTVLYFSAYDELVYRLRSYSSSGECDRNSNSHVGASSWIPLAAGGGARLLASWVTAPFEFLRTRQASLVGAGAASQPSLGMVGEFRTIVEANGFGALYRGLRPTLWRDVPFSAIYWLCVERMRLVWIDHGPAGRIVSPTEQAGQAFMNGAVSGMIAACFTTPFDVLKTRQQQQLQLQSHPPETFAEGRVSLSSKAVSARAVACSHDGAIVFETQAQAQQPSTLASLRQIARTEGVSALWRGNQARMLKVAPACAIMISSYDLGKRILLDER